MFKKLLSICLSILFSTLLFCQKYVPLPTHNAGWKEYYVCEQNNYTIVGDTIINGITYHALYNNNKYYNSNLTGCGPGYTSYGFYDGAFRNDSLNKKVYYVPPNQQNDTLLYDFNLNVGDTLPLHYKYDSIAHSNVNVITVASIDSIKYGDIFEKDLF